ncbi:MAG: asparaginase [Candidatus Marinimicrobia bacterium]|nr:asparaginase [Candidatus Neomarinimicrobiota bacterium]
MHLYCNVTRGGNLESRHEVYALAIDGDGKTIFSAGDTNRPTCIRSSLKPFQASASILANATKSAGFTSKEIALMCASHNGEEIHVQTAKGMLNKLGLKVSTFECGSHAPYDVETRNKARQKGFTPLHNNCSGKHSGMLALAQKLGADTKGYISYSHPVQKTIFDQLKRLTGKKTFPHGIDGCSAPTPFLTLKEIAKLFQTFGSEKYPELTTAYNAMAKHPYLTAGKDRFDTDFNQALQGRGITKVGGEAIRGMVIKTEKYGVVGIAQKIVDGNQRANETAVMTILNNLNILRPNEKEYLKKYETKQLYNHNHIHTGDIEGVIL